MGRQNDPSARAFAAMWAELPLARRRSLTREIRDALLEVKAAGSVNTVHEPMVGEHSHAHHAYGSQGGDQNHKHEHTHGANGTPDANHSHHAEASADHAGKRYAKHVRFADGRVMVMDAGRDARLNASWERAARDSEKGLT